MKTSDAAESAAFDLLEAKVLGIVEQLQEAQEGRKAAEAQVSEFEAKISELEESLAGLRSQNSASERKQATVRDRIEALLKRIDSIS